MEEAMNGRIKQYHILNGDALKAQFPESLLGEIIVARECLVDGTVAGDSLTDFFKTRAEFISNNYEGYCEQEYFEKTVTEFQKMQNIPSGVDVNLWFEDDLFCQVNLWFVLHLLNKSKQYNPIFLIRPSPHNHYGFGQLTKAELVSTYKRRLILKDHDKLASLWELYQINDTEKLLTVSRSLRNTYPFILNAVEAHLERIPNTGNRGRPIESLIRIIKDFKTEEFGLVFNEFCKRERIYGFGDLQVRRLLYEIKGSRQSIL